MKRSQSITCDAVRRVALTFPNVEESTSYGTPALKVKGKLFVRWRNEEDPDTIVLKTPPESFASLAQSSIAFVRR